MTALSDQVAQVETDRDKANADLADALAENARLQAELDALTPKTSTLYGLNFTDTASKYEPRAKVARVYLQSLKGVTWQSIPRIQRATNAGVTTFVVSHKDGDLGNVRAFLATIPAGVTVYVCVNHEPENDHGEPGSAAYATWSITWKQRWADQSPLIRAVGAIPTQILMGWTLYPGSKRDLADWTAPAGTVDCFAFDGYVNSFDPADLVARIVAATKAAGVTRTGLAETGSQVTDKARTTKLTTLKAALDESGMFDWGIYWNDVDPGFDARLNDTDADVWLGTA